jgi:hypothetical protein
MTKLLDATTGQQSQDLMASASSRFRRYSSTRAGQATWTPLVQWHPRLTSDYSQQARQFTYLAEDLLRRWMEALTTFEEEDPREFLVRLAPNQTERVTARVTYVQPKLRVFYEPLPD